MQERNMLNWNKVRPTWDEYFMLQAEIAKLRSNCLTRQIGAVIVRDNRQIATGYNGTPPGILNCIDGGCKRCQERMNGKLNSGVNLERCLCTHAEAMQLCNVHYLVMVQALRVQPCIVHLHLV